MSLCGEQNHTHKCKSPDCKFYFYQRGKRSAEVWEYKQNDRGDFVAKCPKCKFENTANFYGGGIDLVP